MAFTVSSGHTVRSAVLSGTPVAHDSGTVLSGGTAISTTLLDDATLTVAAGGRGIATTLSGVSDTMLVAGVASKAVLEGAGDSLTVVKGGIASGVTVEGGSTATIARGGSGRDFALSDLASLTVAAGATLSGLNQFRVPVSAANVQIDIAGRLIGANIYTAVLTVAAGAVVSDVSIDDSSTVEIAPGGLVVDIVERPLWRFQPPNALVIDEGRLINDTIDSAGTLSIRSGGTASASIVEMGGTVLVSAGGTASNVTGAGFVEIAGGGVGSRLTVSRGGDLQVDSGGTASRLSILSGGTAHIQSGATITSDTMAAGAIEFVASGTVISNLRAAPLSLAVSGITVSSGGRLVLSGPEGPMSAAVFTATSNFREVAASVASGGSIAVSSGGVAYATLAVFGASLTVFDGGRTVSTLLRSFGGQHGGEETVKAGGVAVATDVTRAVLAVSSGGLALDTRLEVTGDEFVHQGGTAIGVDMRHGGAVLRVYEGATATSVTMQSLDTVAVMGGTADHVNLEYYGNHLVVGSGGLASHVTATGGFPNLNAILVDTSGTVVDLAVATSSYVTVSSGGMVSSVTLSAAGFAQVSAGGVMSDVTADSAGRLEISSGGTALEVRASGGDVWVGSGGTLGDVSIVGGGLVALSAGAVDTASLVFVSSGGTIVWGGTGSLGGTVVGFTLGDTIDLPVLTFHSGGSATLSGLVLSVREGGTIDQIHFASGADFTGLSFALSNDGAGGTAVTLVSAGGSLALAPVLHSGG